MRLPLLVSVPHGGTWIPPEAWPHVRLGAGDVERDRDVQSRRIYAVADLVRHHVGTRVARAVVDMNRAPDDRRKDGVLKTHTCRDVPVWRDAVPPAVAAGLLARHRAYHEELTQLAGDVRVCIDGHTMAATGPPVGPDPDRPRPRICLGDGGRFPAVLLDALAGSIEASFGFPPARNDPFGGGYITRHHGRHAPWVQIEVSRAPFMPVAEKQRRMRAALQGFSDRLRQLAAMPPAGS